MIQHLLIFVQYKDGLQASSTKVKHLDCPLVAECRVFEISSPLILVNGILARQKILSIQIFPQNFLSFRVYDSRARHANVQSSIHFSDQVGLKYTPI